MDRPVDVRERNRAEHAGSMVYSAHFLLPIAVGAWLWSKDRADFHRFGLSLVVLCALAFVTYVVWITVVYLGEHYVADVVGGIVYAAIALAIVSLLSRIRAQDLKVARARLS